jgi:hypothetical protein
MSTRSRVLAFGFSAIDAAERVGKQSASILKLKILPPPLSNATHNFCISPARPSELTLTCAHTHKSHQNFPSLNAPQRNPAPTSSASTTPTPSEMASSASKRLFKEYKALSSDPPEGLTAGPVNEDDMFVWEALIQGPEGTPFEGGIFPAELKFPKDYPLAPPKMKFMVDVWHPNGTSSQYSQSGAM